MKSYPSFYPRIALVEPNPDGLAPPGAKASACSDDEPWVQFVFGSGN